MAATYTTTISVRTGADTVSAYFDNTDEQSISLDVTLTASQANKQYNLNFVGARVKAYVIQFDAAATIYVNAASTGSPALTIACVAGVPVIFHSLQGSGSNLFESPTPLTVTNFFITNGVAVANAGKIRVLYDPTP